MKVEESVNEITIKETPGCLWIFGLFFVIMGGILVYGTLGGFSNWNEVETWQLIVAFFVAASIMMGGIWVISEAPIMRVVINRIEDTVSIVKYGFFGKRTNLYRFDEIKQFCLIEDTDSEGDANWSIGMILANSEQVKISSVPLHSEDHERKFVFQINEFMRKQMPSYEKNLKLED